MKWRILSALVCGLALASPQGRAAEYPTRPIKLIVPYAAGGPTDVLGRMVADYLGRDLKQTVVVENKAGAQGAIGAEAAARSEPDGYTLFFTAASLFVLNPLLYKKLPYDPDKDFRMLEVITDILHDPDGSPSLPCQPKRWRSSWPTPNKTPASLISDRPAPAAPPILPAKCSS